MGYYVECARCEVEVSAEALAEIDFQSGEEFTKATLAKCPKCGYPIVGVQEWFQAYTMDELAHSDFTAPTRVWPSPPLHLSFSIPNEIRNSLSEAALCLKAKAFTASVVMSGRALEGIGRHFFPPEDDAKRHLMLGAGLKKLLDTGKIDQRLYEWGTE